MSMHDPLWEQIIEYLAVESDDYVASFEGNDGHVSLVHLDHEEATSIAHDVRTNRRSSFGLGREFADHYDASNLNVEHITGWFTVRTLSTGVQYVAQYFEEKDARDYLAYMEAQWTDDEDTDTDEYGCYGHESLSGAHMGESVYCNGSCITA